jgi:hypothetical protein
MTEAIPPDGANDANDSCSSTGGQAALRPSRDLSHPGASALPPYYPPVTEPREVALQRTKAIIRSAIADGAISGWARRLVHERPNAANKTLGNDLTDTAAARRGLAARYGFAGANLTPHRTLLTGSQGTGKTRLALDAIARIEVPLTVLFFVPTLKKAEEACRDYLKLATETSLPAMVVRGLSAVDPEREDKTMCQRPATAIRVAESGISPRKSICRQCPFRADCGSMRQTASIAALGNKGVYFMSREYLHWPRPAPPADLVIVDERVTIDAVKLYEIPIDTVSFATVRGLVHEPESVAAACSEIDRVREALKSDQALAALRQAGIGRTELRKLREAIGVAPKPSINGSMANADIVAALDAMDPRPLRNLQVLLEALEREIDMPRDVLNGVTYEPATRQVVVSRLRRPEGIERVDVLAMDGTGDVTLNEVLFGQMMHEEVRIERQATVTGTLGRRYSRQSITGRDRAGQPIESRAEGARRLRGDIAHLVQQTCVPTLLVTTKRAEEAMRADGLLPADTMTAHYGALRGSNAYEHCEAVVAAGRESLSIGALERLARTFMADDPMPFVSMAAKAPPDWAWQPWPYRVTRMRRMRNGTLRPVEVEVHPDRRVQRVLEQLREAEILQSIDRVRPVFNRRDVIVMNELVLDLSYDRVLSHQDLVAGGDRVDRAWSLTGVLPETPADLVRAFPHLFGSVDTAARALRESREKGGQTLKGYSIWDLPVFFYRRYGQRGRMARARIAPWHADPRAALEAVIGPVKEFKAEGT